MVALKVDDVVGYNHKIIQSLNPIESNQRATAEVHLEIDTVLV